MIDFHSHILPGVDDGSPDVETSIAMLRAAAEQGVTHVVATPHFYARHDDPHRFLTRRARAEESLREEMTRHEGLPQILIGAEVAFFRGISDSEFLPELTIRGKRCILIEMPRPPWPEEFYRELEEIWTDRNILPVIAHIDRYIRPFRTYDIPQKLALLPVLVQASGDFFTKKSTRRLAMKLLKEDKIHLLGSDCHNMTTRPPALNKAQEAILSVFGESIFHRINKLEQQIFSGPDFIL